MIIGTGCLFYPDNKIKMKTKPELREQTIIKTNIRTLYEIPEE